MECARGGYLRICADGFTVKILRRPSLPSPSTSALPILHRAALASDLPTSSRTRPYAGKRQSTQFYAATNCGATRLDEKKVGVIYADESV
jgi:hypothetical protein